MCGFSAILSVSSQKVPSEAILQKMNDAMVHRGPDGEGVKILSDGGPVVGLGHRRLSIIDLALGHQPMTNEDGTIWITYNGEIYNHADLRRELESKGHQYKTHSDTETIVHAFEEWGPDCVHRLRGMFAFVIWDTKKKELFAVRDRLGIKPFYYVATDETLICASETKSVLASGWLEPKINNQSVPELLTFGYLSGENTLFGDVKKLLPGHTLTWKNGKVETRPYWDIPMPSDSEQKKSEGEWVEEFMSLFNESVSLRLMSDVPLGVFLSGGLDSSSIAATMAKQMADPLKTFSVGFDSNYYSEFDFAREAAKAIGAEHHEIVLQPTDLLASIPELVWHEDGPIRNSSSIALHYVAKLARDHVKVVLTGEGSDELFAGYSRYWATMFNNRWGTWYERCLPRVIRERCIRDTFWKWPLPYSVKSKLSHTFFNHSMRPEEIIFDNFHAILPQRVHKQLFTPEFFDQVRDVDPYHESVRLYQSRGSKQKLDPLLYADQKTYLVELLMKQDKMSMAASIESRVPFLDHKMVEFASRVPPELKLNRQSEKYIVKKSMEKLVPESILNREKMGFPVPIRQWIREGFDRVFRSTLLSDQARGRNIFAPQFVEDLLAENERGERNHTDALWTLMNFEIAARVFVDGDSHTSITDELMTIAKDSPIMA